ncbi:hypothetical protein NMG60_11017435 [Bertholletia excelsa]
MESMELELEINSAQNLKEVGKISNTKVYAKVVLGNKWKTTPVDKKGKTNPTWKCTTRFIVMRNEETEGETGRLSIELYGKRMLRKDKFLGRVRVNVWELYRQRKDGESNILSFPVEDGEGMLTISYIFHGAGAVVNGCTPRCTPSFIGKACVGAVSLVASCTALAQAT